ncbi:MAG: DUF4388 domain-containing protein [Actinomycetota bacterium]|jgi:hypothetical protein|nr:DUF4388 domain-containing protein [Actinomycetota bacterium]
MLQGTLGEFSLPDVFGLLALTKKSGMLKVASGGVEGRVEFTGGEVSFAVSDARRLPLGARLVGAGLVTEEQLRAAGSGAGVQDLGSGLLEAGVADEVMLSKFVREQIVDAVFELLRLEEGTFAFDSGQGGATATLTMSTEQVVDESSGRLAEWDSIKRRLPSTEAVLAMVPCPAGDADRVSLGREQWQLLALIDGRRSVRDVVELTGNGEWATCRVLAELVDDGLVEAADEGTSTRLALLLASREALRRLEEIDAGAKVDLAVPVIIAAVTPPEPSTVAAPAAAAATEPFDAAQPDDPEDVEPTEPSPAPAEVGQVDRGQVARELASLGLD